MLYHAKRDRESYLYQQLVECAKQVEQMMTAIGIGREEVYHHNNEPVSN
jgi:hypothetical protein